MYQRILVPVDGSPLSDRALEEAIRLASLTQASLHLVHVADMQTYAAALDMAAGANAFDMKAAMREAGATILEACGKRVQAAALQVTSEVVEGGPGSVADHVLDCARHWGADLIVLGTHGRRGLGRFLLGSDAEQLLRSSPVPVLLVRLPSSAAGEGPAAAARQAVPLP